MRKYFNRMFKQSTQYAFLVWKEAFLKSGALNISSAENFAIKDTTDELNYLREDNDKLRFKIARIKD